jgi:hypothetical protein
VTGKKRTGRKSKSGSKKQTAKKSATRRSARSSLSIATTAGSSVKQRVAAFAESPLAVCDSDDTLQAMLAVVRNRDEPIKVRLAALQSLGAASFSVIKFESCRADYIATLREVADDPDPELRQRVLGVLAREKDGFAQKKLLDGLQDPSKALVPPEKALQLLSYDVHAEAYSAAREIVKDPPNPVARREALRLLAADSTSAPLFEKLLLDKKEAPEIRQISASALQSLKPEKFQTYAREILMDKSEQDAIQATSLTALTEFGDDTAIAADEPLLKSVDRLSAEATPRVKQNARALLRRYGR